MNCPQNYPYEECPGYNSDDCQCPLNLGVNCHQFATPRLRDQLTHIVDYLDKELNEFQGTALVSDIVNLQNAINSLLSKL